MYCRTLACNTYLSNHPDAATDRGSFGLSTTHATKARGDKDLVSGHTWLIRDTEVITEQWDITMAELDRLKLNLSLKMQHIREHTKM